MKNGPGHKENDYFENSKTNLCENNYSQQNKPT
jgi:hypothetical protein